MLTQINDQIKKVRILQKVSFSERSLRKRVDLNVVI